MDKFNIEVLEDGTIKVTTDAISPASHMAAEAFIREIVTLAGGEATRIQKPHTHAHTHGITHTH